MYIPRLGWTYFILLHLVVIPLVIYLGTFINTGSKEDTDESKKVS
jgi:hypothetical protein